MTVIVLYTRPSKPKATRLMRTFNELYPDATIYISDRTPDDPTWQPINSPEEFKYYINKSNYEIYYNRHQCQYFVRRISDPIQEVTTRKHTHIDTSTERPRTCQTCHYNEHLNCHYYPPPHPQINDFDWCSKHIYNNQ